MSETVKTFDGSKALRSDCRKIQGEYYKIGDPEVENSGQCYYIDGKYWRITTGKIVYDFSIMRYTQKNSSHIYGVIAVESDGTVKLGHFSNTLPFEFAYLYHDGEGGNRYPILDPSSIDPNGVYRYKRSEDAYYHKTKVKTSTLHSLKSVSSDYKRSLEYGAGPYISEYTKYFNKYYNPEKLYDFVEKYGDFIKDYTFGVEFESIRGRIPERLHKPLGLIPLRDGSISGLEYVTIPLSGKKGLNAVIDSCNMLDVHTSYDDSCSTHLHIGNVPRTEEFFLAFFKVICLLQEELFSFFPIYKKHNYSVKRQNYTKPLPLNIAMSLDRSITSKKQVRDNFELLFQWLSGGSSYVDNFSSLSSVRSHPSDPENRSKWNINSRYYHVNFIPLLFGNKQTIEFRIHTPTYDGNKIMNFIALCTSLIDFTIKNESKILKDFSKFKNLSVNDVLRSCLHGDISSYISRYFNSRSSAIESHMSQKPEFLMGSEDDINSGRVAWVSEKSRKIRYMQSNRSTNIFRTPIADLDMTIRGLRDTPTFNRGVANPRGSRRS